MPEIDIKGDNVELTDKATIENETKEVVKKEANVLVALPCQEMMNTQFVASLIGLQRPPKSKIVFTQSSILPQSRDTLANMAINNGYTHILFIDSDMTFPPDALHRLFSRDVDIVTGLCFARKGDHNPCIYKDINYTNPKLVNAKNNENITVETDIDRDFFEIKACGMAFCLIKTSALLDIRTKNEGNLFRYLFNFGEDLSFCVRALKAGYKIWCDTTFTIGHVGEHIYTRGDWNMTLATKAAIAKAMNEQQQNTADKADIDLSTIDETKK